MTWAVVRVRGSIHAKWDIVDTLKELRLNRPNHVVILPETPSFKGMIDKVQGYVTWGPVSEESVALLIDKKLGGDPGKGATSPLFRLKPPKGGWKSTKKPYTMGGALGFRAPETTDNMDHLLRRML
jgi:large subunit ribosomal protein L30